MPEPYPGLAGCFVALVTPMMKDGSIDRQAHRELIEWHIEAGTDGIVSVGTTGESPTVTTDEQGQIIADAVKFAAGRVPIIAGTGANSTAEAVALTKIACAHGASCCLSVVPYYNRPPQEGLLAHFRAIAEVATKPIILYNVPNRTSCDLADDTVIALASHPRIVGIKDATGYLDRLRRQQDAIGDNFTWFSGDDGSCMEYTLAGGHGVISVSANIAPKPMAAMIKAALAGNRTEAARLHKQVSSFTDLQGIQANPIPVKWALHATGRIGPGIRLPLVPLAAKHRPAVEAAADRAAAV